MNDAIEREALNKRISRLCHFTPARNLVHIATGAGLASTRALQDAERKAFSQQDLLRLDGYPDHICCSIEYPNVWYFANRMRNLRSEDRIFRDWVVLGIDPKHLAGDATLFCPRNAAAEGGRLVGAGMDIFISMFAEPVVGARGMRIRRDAKPPSCPTDDQAEVLIHREVPLNDVHPIFVRDVPQAKRTFVGLEAVGAPVERFRIVVAPSFFNPRQLSQIIRSGNRPVEAEWDPASLDA